MQKKRIFSLTGWALLVLAAFGGALAGPWRQGLQASVYLPLVQRPALLPATPPEEWLARLNYYRALAALPAVTENTDWSHGDYLHARYCVKNDYIGHSEEPANPWYTPEGALAASKGNVTVSSNVNRPDWDAIDSWMTGPFHAVGMVDPQLAQAGYGSYREADGDWQMAATLDVLRGLGSVPSSVAFPVMWPGDGATVFLNAYRGGETPNPLSGCAGYTAPAGLPVILQIGSGSTTPAVTAHSVKRNGVDVEHCIFDETSYTNSDPNLQSLGRSVLGSRDAIVVIPREPLTPDAPYTFSVTANGNTHTWSFSVANGLQRRTRAQDDGLMR
ncbi:MAG: CAP domain-containing protein [Chloroflexota bacterium]